MDVERANKKHATNQLPCQNFLPFNIFFAASNEVRDKTVVIIQAIYECKVYSPQKYILAHKYWSSILFHIKQLS